MPDEDTRLSSMIHNPVRALMTALGEIVTVDLRTSVQEARHVASLGPFDQLAVVETSDRREIVGLVCVDQLAELPSTDVVEAQVDRDLTSIGIQVTAALPEMLRRLVQHSTLLVVDEHEVVGLIHRSDLNKQPMRVALYAEIVELEMGLSRLVEEAATLDTWIGCLRETSQIQVLGRREVDRRSNNEISPLQYLNLSDLVDIVGRLELNAAVGYGSKTKWDKAAKGLVHLRNCVMHPVRYLVTDTKSVEQLLERDERLRGLLQALRLRQSAGSRDRDPD